MHNRYFAQCPYNAEFYLQNELKEFNVRQVSPSSGGVYFSASFEEMMKINYNVRTATRILMIVKEFPWEDEKDLYNQVKSIPWNKYFTKYRTILLYNNTDAKYVKNSKMLSLITKDALCDKFRITDRGRPNIEKNNPNIRIFVSIIRKKCSILIDTSGESLNKRGYRINSVEAPIRETLASALIMASQWNKKVPFVDFMSGSGTIPIEAALMASNTPPQIIRKEFSFYYLKNFSFDVWKNIKIKSKKNIVKIKRNIFASDIDDYAVKIGIENSKRIYMFSNIIFERKDFKDMSIDAKNGIIIVNPPYGKRLENRDQRAFYIELKEILKQKFNNWTFFMIADAVSHGFLGLKADERIKFYNGPIEVLFEKYRIR